VIANRCFRNCPIEGYRPEGTQLLFAMVFRIDSYAVCFVKSNKPAFPLEEGADSPRIGPVPARLKSLVKQLVW
jgi:hypothetical protein